MHSLLRNASLAALSLLALPACAQAPAPAALPDLPLYAQGTVLAIARLPDGGTLLGGSFVRVNGQPRANLAKLAPDGSLDPDWNPGADAPVHAIAVDGSGHVFVGGSFRHVGGQTHAYAAKLSVSGAGVVDANWNPNPDAPVEALGVDNAGQVFAGGFFSQIGGQARTALAKLSATGSGAADAQWNPAPDNSVFALALDATGHVYAGGLFTSVNGSGGREAHARIVRLQNGGNGSADAAWVPSVDSGNVQALALDEAGAIYVGGYFATVNGSTRSHLAKLSVGGAGALSAWNAAADNGVLSVATDSAGNVYVAGGFGHIGGQTRHTVAKLSGLTAAADATWAPDVDSSVFRIAADNGGTTVIGGNFEVVSEVGSVSAAVLDASGNVAVSAEVQDAGVAQAMVRRSDGSVVVGGSFYRAGSASRRNLLRLRADGSLDPNWTPDPGAAVAALAIDAQDNVYVGGGFTTIAAVARAHLAKFQGDAAATLDPLWNPGVDDGVFALAVDGANHLYLGGYFNQVGGQSRTAIARVATGGSGSVDTGWQLVADYAAVSVLALDPAGDVYAGGQFQFGNQFTSLAKLSGMSGAHDTNWNAVTTGDIDAIAIDADANLFVGGRFDTIGGEVRHNLAKLSGLSGAADPLWAPGTDDPVYSIVLDGHDSVFIGGAFGVAASQTRSHLAKLSASGSGLLDADWDPAIGPNGRGSDVRALIADPNGALYVGGIFQSLGGAARLSLARVPTVADRIFANSFE